MSSRVEALVELRVKGICLQTCPSRWTSSDNYGGGDLRCVQICERDEFDKSILQQLLLDRYLANENNIRDEVLTIAKPPHVMESCLFVDLAPVIPHDVTIVADLCLFGLCVVQLDSYVFILTEVDIQRVYVPITPGLSQ